MDTKSRDAQVSLSTASLYFQSSLCHLHYLIQCKHFVNSYKYSVNTTERVATAWDQSKFCFLELSQIKKYIFDLSGCIYGCRTCGSEGLAVPLLHLGFLQLLVSFVISLSNTRIMLASKNKWESFLRYIIHSACFPFLSSLVTYTMPLLYHSIQSWVTQEQASPARVLSRNFLL